jgi:hypothetical protein
LFEDVHVRCTPKQVDAFVGDTIRFTTGDTLPFRVVFDGSPFSIVPAIEITDSIDRQLRTSGRFFFKCFVTRLIDGEEVEVGWFFGEDPESGGDVDVRP